jgi:hypothetical protein
LQTRRKYLEENFGAFSVKDLARIEEIAPHGAAAGHRYLEHMMALINKIARSRFCVFNARQCASQAK